MLDNGLNSGQKTKCMCPNCGREAKLYIEIKNSPCLQNVLYRSYDEAIKVSTIDANFYICDSCVYLFNPDFMVNEVDYDAEYNNDQSHSKVYCEHIENVLNFLSQSVDFNNGVDVLEIGCGNGQLLSLLKEVGAKILGYDPSYQGDFSVENYVVRDYWKAKENKNHDLIILRHTLEGLHEPKKLFEDIKKATHDESWLYIEINDLGSILRKGEMCNLYHECARYFSVTSISVFLANFGFEIYDLKHYMGNNWLGVLAKRISVNKPKNANLNKLEQFKRILIWGMAGRSIQFITHNKISLEKINFGVDIDPSKQNMFVPVEGQKILSVEDAVQFKPELIIVLNSAYKKEVKDKFNYPVEILTAEEIYEF